MVYHVCFTPPAHRSLVISALPPFLLFLLLSCCSSPCVSVFACFFVCVVLFVVGWFVCWLVGLFVCLFACLFVRSFVRSFLRLFVCLLACFFVCLLVCLILRSKARLTQSGSKRLLVRIWVKTARSQWFQKQISIASWKPRNCQNLVAKGSWPGFGPKSSSRRPLARIWPKTVRSQGFQNQISIASWNLLEASGKLLQASGSLWEALAHQRMPTEAGGPPRPVDHRGRWTTEAVYPKPCTVGASGKPPARQGPWPTIVCPPRPVDHRGRVP